MSSRWLAVLLKFGTVSTIRGVAIILMRKTVSQFHSILVAGGKELALLIFFFSFAWPYTKQILTLVIWFAPTKKLSVNTRGSTLLWLDALAKWSMVDIFVLVVTIVAFRVSIKR